ncbi:MAG: hypothetical protein WD042_07995 [Phycisphaeraceae bacterium]
MSDTLWAATRKGLFRITRGSKGRWRIHNPAFLGQNLPMMLPDPRRGQLYAAISHGHFGGKMHRSSDDGKTWQEIAVPAIPARVEGEAPVVNAASGQATPDTLQLVWSMETGGDGTLWCGTIPGGLFSSSDQGATWQINRPLWDHPMRKQWFGGGAEWPGIHSICIDPRDPRKLRVGVSSGGVWLSDDAGQSWRVHTGGMRAAYMPPDQAMQPQTQDPHRLVQCPADPDQCWVQHHNGIFQSRDGGANWREITTAKPSSFGFAVVVHPRDPKTAWFVPGHSDELRTTVGGKLVVSRTRDGGESFDILTAGLPQRHAYDLTFRHGLDIDDTGDTLAFGTTTGALFVSDNGGEKWQRLSAHLPPVYCVRFAK